MASRAGPWGAGSSATTEEPLCFLAELGLSKAYDVAGGWGGWSEACLAGSAFLRSQVVPTA